MATTIQFDQAALHRLLEGEQGPVAKDLLRRAYRVEGAAKRACPVGTPESTGIKGYAGGRLRSSITHALAQDSRGLLALVGSNVYYAIYVEMGTRYMRPRPFLRGSLRAAA